VRRASVAVSLGRDPYEVASEALGRVNIEIEGDAKVVIKPNMCCKADPDSGLVTRPEVVEAFVDEVEGSTSDITVIESNLVATGTSCTESLKFAGFGCLERRGVRLLSLSEDEQVSIDFPDLKIYEINIAKTLLDADLLINVPVLKTHTCCAVTLGLKNLFGLTSRADKAVFHEQVYDVMLELYKRFRPGLTLIDGITGSEGWCGEVFGYPLDMGVVLASKDMFAVDKVASELMGFKFKDLHQYRLAYGRGLIDFDEIDILGESPAMITRDFKHQRAVADSILHAIANGEDSKKNLYEMLDLKGRDRDILGIIDYMGWIRVSGDSIEPDMDTLMIHYNVFKKAYPL